MPSSRSRANSSWWKKNNLPRAQFLRFLRKRSKQKNMTGKILRLAIACLLVPVISFAQLSSVAKAAPLKVDLGIKLGANFSKLEGSIWNNKYNTGYLFG